MIGAIIKNDLVENVIVLNEEQISELEEALECEIIDARPYGLTIGDLRTEAGWTRNAGGEQLVLSLLDAEQYDGYTKAMQRVSEVEAEAEIATEMAIEEALMVLAGEVE